MSARSTLLTDAGDEFGRAGSFGAQSEYRISEVYTTRKTRGTINFFRKIREKEKDRVEKASTVSPVKNRDTQYSQYPQHGRQSTMRQSQAYPYEYGYGGRQSQRQSTVYGGRQSQSVSRRQSRPSVGDVLAMGDFEFDSFSRRSTRFGSFD